MIASKHYCNTHYGGHLSKDCLLAFLVFITCCTLVLAFLVFITCCTLVKADLLTRGHARNALFDIVPLRIKIEEDIEQQEFLLEQQEIQRLHPSAVCEQQKCLDEAHNGFEFELRTHE